MGCNPHDYFTNGPDIRSIFDAALEKQRQEWEEQKEAELKELPSDLVHAIRMTLEFLGVDQELKNMNALYKLIASAIPDRKEVIRLKAALSNNMRMRRKAEKTVAILRDGIEKALCDSCNRDRINRLERLMYDTAPDGDPVI